MPDALTLLETRRTISTVSLRAPGPSDSEIETLIRVAARVPDHGKLAPWRFVLYRGPGMAALGERLAAIFVKRNPSADAARIELERTRFSRAPLVIGVISRAAPHVKIPEWEQVLSAGAATMNLLLAVHALGYAGQWLTDWCAYDAEAAAVLGLKEGERFAGFVSIGTPDVPPVDRPRPAFADIVTEWKA
jgi:nitroreductase